MQRLISILAIAAIAFAAGMYIARDSRTESDEPAAAAPEPRKAKNVILFIGDGMGVSTVTAARIFDGQSRGLAGEEHVLPFETFPNVALVKTYNTNQQVSDSAGTATAMHTGVKTRAGVINIGPAANRQDCLAAQQNTLESIGQIAKRRGAAVGVVTTARVTHATPATVYAHAPERDWEGDRFMTNGDITAGCRDIARQLLEFDTGGGIDLVLGGGRRAFYGRELGGRRNDPWDNLVEAWQAGSDNRVVLETATDLEALQPGQQALGLFANSHMTYLAERLDDSTEPLLSEMTAAAIDHLAADPDGYYLMVEGGRIDHGHHDGLPGYALLQAQEFARAVEVALSKVDLEETLVIVTADHSHVFTIAGYPVRGNPILGLVVHNDRSGESRDEPALARDGMPYTTLGYMNGPGARVGEPRGLPQTGISAVYQGLVPL